MTWLSTTWPDEANEDWSVSTLDRGGWLACLLGITPWLVGIGGIVAVRRPDLRVGLLSTDVLFIVVSVGALRARSQIAPRMVFFLSCASLLSADLAAAPDRLTDAIVCMSFVLIASPSVVLPPLAAAATTTAGVTVATVVALHSRLGTNVAAAIIVPTSLYALAGGVLISQLRRHARSMDRQIAFAQAETERLLATRRAAYTAREYVRVMHDTVLNTIAAVASGVSGDSAQVRARCREDVAALTSLTLPSGTATPGLSDMVGNLGVSVAWVGLDRESSDAAVALLERSRRQAVCGIVRELLVNVEKHTESRTAELDVELRNDQLILLVRDKGPGFVHAPQPGRGLAESVSGRAAEAGVGVTVTSTAAGTSVELRVPMTGEPHVATGGDGDFVESAKHILLKTTWGWSVAVSSAGLATATVADAPAQTFAADGMVFGAVIAAAWCCRGDRVLPRWLALILVALLPVAFLEAFSGAHATLQGGNFWQGIGITPLLVILLTTGRAPVYPIAGVATLLTTAACVAAHVWPRDVDAAATALANATMQVAELGVWVIFSVILGAIGTRVTSTRREALASKLERAALDAAVAVQSRWRGTQLDNALALLDDIGAGHLSADDPEVRRHAAREEHFLRQLILLPPDLVHLAPWLTRALAQARERDVTLTTRISGDVAHDLAERFGRTLMSVLDAVPPGAAVTAAQFGSSRNTWLSITGPKGVANVVATCPTGDVRAGNYASQDLIEFSATPA